MPSITITLDAAQSQRVAGAFGRYWQLGRPATAAEVKEYLVQQLRGVVVQQERGVEEAKVVIAELVMT